MPECRVIPYFRGFLLELKEILSMGVGGGAALSPLIDSYQATLAANSVVDVEPVLKVSSFSSPAHSSTFPAMQQHQTVTLGGSPTTSTTNNSLPNNTSNKDSVYNSSSNNCYNNNFIGSNCNVNSSLTNNSVKSNNVGPTSLSSLSSCSSLSSTGPGTKSSLGGKEGAGGSHPNVVEAFNRGIQTNMVRSPQEQRRDTAVNLLGKHSQRKVVSL